MLKLTTHIMLAIIILVAGYTGFNKLRYWEKSSRIFSLDEQRQVFEGMRNRGNGNREAVRYGSFIPRPDSAGMARGNGNFSRSATGFAEDHENAGDFHVREHSRQGKVLNFSNSIWFLAVFALFTLITIYADRLISGLVKKSEFSVSKRFGNEK